MALTLSQPALTVDQDTPLARLPGPARIVERLRGTAFAAEAERLSTAMLQHRFPILGMEIEAGAAVQWRRDYASGKESSIRYFRLIPYLDFTQVGDHKAIWELNRHQHLVLLAQTFLLTGREEFLAETRSEWESWVASNPHQRSINWASALEVAFRALSWSWVYHLTGQHMESGWRRHFLAELYRHGRHIENNLSVYFSPNTHLLGEAVALHALGVLFPAFPRARDWENAGGRIVRQELERQVRADGAHFEQSTYYHVYALDFFLFHYILAGRPAEFAPVLLRMAEYLESLLDPAGSIPFIGDDDGGRLFHPYGRRDRFGRATLATCAILFDRPDWLLAAEDVAEQAMWWLGAEQPELQPKPRPVRPSRLFPQTGVAILRAGDLSAIVDTGGFGPFRAGHSHSDTLSVVVRSGEDEILIDPGTYTYVGDPRWRDWFRSSAAHNTVRIDGKDQAAPLGPFGWSGKPETGIRAWRAADDHNFLDAWCRYPVDGVHLTHRRRVLLVTPDLMFMLDEIKGDGDGEHLVEQFWHAGGDVTVLSQRCFGIAEHARLVLGGEASLAIGGEDGWRSRVFGEKTAAPVIRASCRSTLPVVVAAVLVVSGEMRALELMLRKEDDGIWLELTGDRALAVRFGAHWEPQYQL